MNHAETKSLLNAAHEGDVLACLALADDGEENNDSVCVTHWRRKAFVLTELSKMYDGDGHVDPEKLFKAYGRFLKSVKVHGTWERQFEIKVGEGIRKGYYYWGWDRPRQLTLDLTTTPGDSRGEWVWEQRRGWVIPSRAKGVPSELVLKIMEALAEQLTDRAAEEAFPTPAVTGG